MRVFLYHLEELYNDSRNGVDGSIAAAFPPAKALFGDIIYRHRSGAFAFKHTILKGPFESSYKKTVGEDLSAAPQNTIRAQGPRGRKLILLYKLSYLPNLYVTQER